MIFLIFVTLFPAKLEQLLRIASLTLISKRLERSIPVGKRFSLVVLVNGYSILDEGAPVASSS